MVPSLKEGWPRCSKSRRSAWQHWRCKSYNEEFDQLHRWRRQEDHHDNQFENRRKKEGYPVRRPGDKWVREQKFLCFQDVIDAGYEIGKTSEGESQIERPKCHSKTDDAESANRNTEDVIKNQCTQQNKEDHEQDIWQREDAQIHDILQVW